MTPATVSDIRPALQAPPEGFQSNTTHPGHPADPPAPPSRGDKTKARDLLAALHTLTRLEQQRRPPTPPERQALARFPGFGPLALRLFPDPATGHYRDVTWQQLGEELRALLSPDEYDSARRTTFTAFYTSTLVIRAMHKALARLGVPPQATVLEPGCGIGKFIGEAPPGMRFIGIELDALSGRIALALYPTHDIRIENFRDTHLPEGRIDAVIGNVPFADITYTYHGQRLSLHDFFLAKTLEALKPGGVLALVTSHYTLDKLNTAHRESLAEQADFLGAIRLPSETFKQEGTQVVTDIVFLHKRGPGEAPQHGGDAWLRTEPLTIGGVDIPINAYFLRHPDMVLGAWSRQDRLYGSEATYSLRASGDLAAQLHAAVARLPEGVYSASTNPTATHLPLPPLAGQLTEGSFFVADDRTIMQVQGGAAVAVTHGDRPVKADGSLMGRRLAALIALRDQARRVLASQNEGWSEAERQAARRALGRVYDHFVATYGPINKTTVATTREGTVIRRLPNLVKFRDDPDAMLVMSLEDYDEDSGTAVKAAIMHQDVVGRTPPVTSVPSAEEGLLVCLNQRGQVGLPFIASLYGAPVAQTTSELGDLIYQDPASGQWQTNDVYLSGNVRAKLQAAEAAGPRFARNAEALRAVQPEDVLPGDIDAHLGAPWIPASDIQAFAAELFGIESTATAVAHLPKEALWSVAAERSATASVAATTTYGTERVSGVRLLELALNLQTPVIYDTIMTNGREERVLNQTATLAARDKQQQIAERFRTWLFAEAERSERLVRRYNDTYNNIRLRAFDGSHLDFPGMNPTLALRPVQKDAVWRIMSSGNTLLAHAVGAGKTFIMAAAGMKMKQAGLITKPVYVVPNHMLEQFARAFMQLYPGARLLMAGKEDLRRERRKLLTARIASGAWDGILVTHSSFERIGLSRAFQERFVREHIAAYDQLLTDHARADTSPAHRNLIKAIEKHKARHEARLHDLLARDKKDDGLVFDELGVDYLFVDEAHLFKNLETPTKMERVAGIQTTGSERAFDLYMKTRFLHEQRPGRGVTFATGTPISNTMVEMYTLQRYLDPEGLEARGLAHFDAWAATFGEVVETMEIAPDGARLRPRSRFARFTNLPELQQMFRAFADVQTADRLDLPRPRLSGEQARVVSCPMSEAQRTLQAGLVERYDRLRTQKVDPREDNALAITTDGRKLALDARLLSPTAPAFAGSKIQALVANVASLWQRTAATRGTQLIFCDLGVHPTPWGYGVYQEITHALVQLGLPRTDIATIGEADSDARKHALFEKVRSGAVRVLLGSTQKLGTGTNVQQRLVALQHLDAPWKAAEVEQRDGRILRPGTLHDEVAIYRYVTEGSFDAYMWQALETKARFIAQVMSGDLSLRQAEDIDSEALSYAQVKAIASGNPAVLTLAEVDAELARLRVLHKHHSDEQYLARLHARQLPNTIVRLEQRLAALTQDMATAEAHKGDPLTIGNRTCLRDEAVAHLAACLKDIPSIVLQRRQVPLGRYQGLPFALVLSPAHDPEICVEGATTRLGTLSREHHGPRAILNAVERVIGSYGAVRASTEKELALAQGQLRDYCARLGADFAHGAYLAALSDLRQQLATALSAPEAPPDGAAVPPLDTLVANFKALKAKHRIEPAPQRLSRHSAATLAEPVTTRIRRRRTPEPPPQPEAEPTAPAPLPLPTPPSAAALTLLDIPVPCGDGAPSVPPTPARAARKRTRRRTRTPTTQLRLF